MRADGRLRVIARRLERPAADRPCPECGRWCPLVLVADGPDIDIPTRCEACGRPCYLEHLPLVIRERPDGPA